MESCQSRIFGRLNTKKEVIKMKTKIKLLIFLAGIILLSQSAYSANEEQKKIEDLSKVPLDKIEIDRSEIVEWIKLAHEKIIKEKDPMRAIMYTAYIAKYDFFSKHPDIEKETLITKAWYQKSSNILTEIQKMKYLMEAAELNHEKTKFNKANEVYKDLIGKYDYIYKHPEKIKKKKTAGK